MQSLPGQRVLTVLAGHSRLGVSIVFCVGVIISAISALAMHRAEVSGVRYQFEAAAENRVSALRREIESATSSLRSFRALFRQSGEVGPEVFAEHARETQTKSRALQEWAWVTPSYQVKASAPGTRERLDKLLERTEVRKSLEDAKDPSKLIATAPLEANGRSILLGLPMHARGQLVGYTVVLMDAGALLEDSMAYLRPFGVDVCLYDRNDTAGPWMYRHRSRKHTHGADQPCSGTNWGFPDYVRTAELGDRSWAVRCVAVPEYVAAAVGWNAWGLFAAGLLTTFLTSGLVKVLADRASSETLHRQRTESELRAEVRRFHELFEGSPEIVFTTDNDGRLLSLNRAGRIITGYAEGEPLSETLRLSGPLATIKGREGREHILELEVVPLTQQGKPNGYLGLGRDVTSRKHLEQFDAERHRIFAMVAQGRSLDEIVAEIQQLVEAHLADGFCATMLKRGSRLVTVGRSRLTESPLSQRLEIAAETVACGKAAYWARPVFTADIRTDETWHDHRDAAAATGVEACWSMPLLSGSGQVMGAFSVFRAHVGLPDDYEQALLERGSMFTALAVEHRQFTDRLVFHAQHDYLTALPNRLLLRDRLQQAIANAQRTGRMVALLYLDLDGFKLVNDTLGHPVGDSLLRLVAERLQARIRQSDTLARMGGDEFTLVLGNIDQIESAEKVAVELLEELRKPFCVEGHELFISASIGVAIAPRDGDDETMLQKHADAALYRAKRGGKNTVRVFSPETDTKVVGRLELLTDLHHALDRGEFQLYYQPQVEVASGVIIGFEVLLRWHHPELGIISPVKFIPIAEDTGLIIPIGEWVLREACRQVREWRDQGLPPVKVAVNVSAIQWAQPDWVDTVSSAIAEHRIDPAWLELELTESAVLQNMAESSRQMERLRAYGVSISVDDFGTGYASLSYLQSLPISKLKIDLSFIRRIAEAGSDPSLVESIVELAAKLGLRVTAEGVETEHQMEVLRGMNCHEAQGYLLGRPTDHEGAMSLLSRGVDLAVVQG